uniref:Mon2/Sec7/BIG1-like HDS domain-containing protein n=1 Tax=Strongyloides stercoralis TaxID=6248 RepID=A0A0K0DSG7_STRER
MDKIFEKLAPLIDQTTSNNVLVKGYYEKAKDSIKMAHLPIESRRGDCLIFLSQCLINGKSRLSHVAFEGLQFIIQDSTYSSDYSTKKEEDTLPSQLVKNFQKMPEWDKQIQCQSLTLIMQLFSSSNIRICSGNIDECMQLCIKTYLQTDETSVKLAVRATITQIINSFCLNKYAKTSPGNQDEIAVFMEMTALIKKFITRLETEELGVDEIILLLDAIYSLLSVQPIGVCKHKPFLNALDDDLGTLIKRMFEWCSPKRSKQGIQLPSILGSEKNCSKVIIPDIFFSNEMVSSIYQIVEHLIRIYSKNEESQEILNRLFHLVFLQPPVSVRGEGLKLIKRLFTNQVMLFCVGRLLLQKTSFWNIIMDCLLECSQCNIPQILTEAIKILGAISNGLCELKSICNERGSIEFVKDNFPSYQPNVDVFYVNEINENDCDVKVNKKINIESEGCTNNSDNNNDICLKELAKIFVDFIEKKLDKILESENYGEIDEIVQNVAVDIYKKSQTLENINSHYVVSDLIYLTIWSTFMYESVKMNKHNLDKEVFLAIITHSGSLLFMNENFVNEVFFLLQSRETSIFNGKKLLNKEGKVNLLFDMIEDITGFVLGIGNTPPAKGNDNESFIRNFNKTIHHMLHYLISSRWEVFCILLAKQTLKGEKRHLKEKCLSESKTLQSLAKMSLSLNYSTGVEFALDHLVELICPLEEIRTRDFSKPKYMDFRKIWQDGVEDLEGISFVIEYGLNFGILASTTWKYIIITLEYIYEMSFLLPQEFTTTPSNENSIPSSPLPIPTAESSFSSKDIVKILYYLNHIATKFIDTASLMLPLPDLRRFVVAIGNAIENKWKWCDEKIAIESRSDLFGVFKTIMFKSKGKPLIHTMSVWNLIKLSLIDMASIGDKEKVVGSSIECMRDSTIIHLRNEKEGFNTNMFFFDSFQLLVVKDVLTIEGKEQIIQIFSDIVTRYNSSLGTGWKPLFSALKSINNAAGYGENAVSTYISFAIMDVFAKYMEIKDIFIQMSTMSEFIVCLTQHMQSKGMIFGTCDVTSDKEEEEDETLGEAALCCISKIQILLLRRFNDNDFNPIGQLLKRIDKRVVELENENEISKKINERIHNLKDIQLSIEEDIYIGKVLQKLSSSSINLSKEYNVEITESCWDKFSDSQKCVIELILSLCEQLSALLITCNQQMHSKIRQNLVDFLMTISSSAIGPNLTGYILCNNLLPIMNNWLTTDSFIDKEQGEIGCGLKNFRQTMGLITNLAQEYISENLNNIWTEKLLLDLLELFNNSISQSFNLAIPRIAISCLKHLTQSLCNIFTSNCWLILSYSLYKTFLITLQPLRELCEVFYPKFNEMESVELMLNENIETPEAKELLLLAKEMFFIDDNNCPNQNAGVMINGVIKIRENTQNCGKTFKDIPIKEFFSNLVNHRLLLNFIDEVLLTPCFKDKKFDMCLTSKKIFLIMLLCSGYVTSEADRRPALKNVIKKIVNEEREANFYKLTGATWSVLLNSFYNLSINDEDSNIKQYLQNSESSHWTTLLLLTINCLKDTIVNLENESIDSRISAAIRERSELSTEFTLIQLDNSDIPNNDDTKVYKIIKTEKSIEEFNIRKKRASVNAMPKRMNPFSSTSNLTLSKDYPDDGDKNQYMSYIMDTDLNILTLSSTLSKLILQFTREEKKNFEKMLPLFNAVIPDLNRISTSSDVREAISLYIERMISNYGL